MLWSLFGLIHIGSVDYTDASAWKCTHTHTHRVQTQCTESFLFADNELQPGTSRCSSLDRCSGILCIWESRITTVMICHAIFRWKICSKPRKTAMIVPFLQIKLRQHLLLLYWRMRQVRFFPSAHRVVNQEGSALQLHSLKIALQDCLVSHAEGNSKFLCAACPAPHSVLSMPMWRYLSVKPQSPGWSRNPAGTRGQGCA